MNDVYMHVAPSLHWFGHPYICMHLRMHDQTVIDRLERECGGGWVVS